MIVNRQRAVRLARRPLELFLRRVKNELGFGEAGVTVCLVSDAEIARMNETFRKKKGPTDVLSFPSAARRRPVRLRRGSGAAITGEYLGDIVISPATARRYARKRSEEHTSELQSLAYLVCRLLLEKKKNEIILTGHSYTVDTTTARD